MAREYTRSFSIPAGTVIDGVSIPARTFTATRTGNTKSPAQRAARREAADYVSRLLGRNVGPTELNRATARVNKQTGRARGGRKPRTQIPQRLAGFTRTRSESGFETWRRGGTQTRGTIAEAYDAIAAFLDARARRIPPQPDAPLVVRVALNGTYDERSHYFTGSGAEATLWHWSSTPTFDARAFSQLFPTPDSIALGPDFPSDPTGGTGIDFDSIRAITVHVDTGERG